MTTLTTDVEPFVLLDATVHSVERLSPSFARITFGGEGFDQLGPDGPTLDLRIKLLIPSAGRSPATGLISSATWYADWLALPEADRGHLRTYTARRVFGEGGERRLVVDFVLHGTEGHVSPGARGSHGPVGPAAAWAAAALPGARLGLLAPRRGYEAAYGGVEFAPGDATELFLVADETALPAVSSILESLPRDATGTAVVEVPDDGDVLALDGPAGVRLEWVVRGGAARGTGTIAAVSSWCRCDLAGEPGADIADDELWETPTYSSSGEMLEDDAATAERPNTYAWVASDAATVKVVRRILVGEVGLPRHRLACMGYWKAPA